MNTKIVAGNWKMNLTYKEALSLFVSVNEITAEDVEVIVAPASVYLAEFAQHSPRVKLAAQNVCHKSSGAFTGEISAQMINALNVEYCIVGHSERRSIFGETNQMVNHKVHQLLTNNVAPIFCCGEPLEAREKNQHNTIVQQQVTIGLGDLSKEQMYKCIIAYEPVWAIGTGLTATAEQAQQMHAFIRDLIASLYDIETANSVRILYGGSCNSTNSSELFSQKDVNGGLIGGASLKKETFGQIIDSF